MILSIESMVFKEKKQKLRTNNDMAGKIIIGPVFDLSSILVVHFKAAYLQPAGCFISISK